MPQSCHSGHRVVNRLIVDREAHCVGHQPLAVLSGALLVAEHRNALPRQAPRQVAERLFGTDGLVPTIGTGSVHQHNRRKGSAVGRQRDRPGEDPVTITH